MASPWAAALRNAECTASEVPFPLAGLVDLVIKYTWLIHLYQFFSDDSTKSFFQARRLTCHTPKLAVNKVLKVKKTTWDLSRTCWRVIATMIS